MIFINKMNLFQPEIPSDFLFYVSRLAIGFLSVNRDVEIRTGMGISGC